MAKIKTLSPKIKKEEVKHIAKLARLPLTKEELKKFQFQLSEILEYMKILNKVNTDSVEPTTQITGLKNILREDKISPSLPPEKALLNAAEKLGNFFKTKIILKK